MGNKNFGRSYRLIAGPAGGAGFETTELHIAFSIERTDLSTSNTARLDIWNLNDEHKALLKAKDCAVALHAGYGTVMPLVFAGGVSFVSTTPDGTDKKTTVEVEDGLIATKDTYVSISYEGKINSKTILDDVAGQMGVAVTYSYNAEFVDIPNGYSFVGMAKDVLSVICKTSNLSWSIQNGVLQIKKPGDVMSQEVFELSEETGLIGFPQEITVTADDDSKQDVEGWDVEFLMNAAINVDDFVFLKSKTVTGYFRVYSIAIEGDTEGSAWQCKARLLEVKG